MSRKEIYHGLGNRQPQWKLDYIKEHAPYSKAPILAQELGLSTAFIYEYCLLKDIPLSKKTYEYVGKPPISSLFIHERIKRFSGEVKQPIVRPKAVYDNKSREERINELLSENC
jgi:hypothetical protein